MQNHLVALADDSAESSVRREAALAIGALRDTATPADVEHVLQLLGSPHDCEVGGGAISVRRAALLAFTELARGPDGGVPAAVTSNVELLSKLTRAREVSDTRPGRAGARGGDCSECWTHDYITRYTNHFPI